MTERYTPEFDREQENTHHDNQQNLISEMVTTSLDQATHVGMTLSMAHPDGTQTLTVLLPIPVRLLTSQLVTPQRDQDLAAFRQGLGNAVNNLLNTWQAEHLQVQAERR